MIPLPVGKRKKEMQKPTIEDKKVAYLIRFFNNQSYILSERYHDEKSSNIANMTANIIQSIWTMDNEQFEKMYNEGL